MPIFGLKTPKAAVGPVPYEILNPKSAWAANGLSEAEFDSAAKNLAGLFVKNFRTYADRCTAEVVAAGPAL